MRFWGRALDPFARAGAHCWCRPRGRDGARARAGKAKDLGNMILGKFGLSTDNFKMDKDPNTGSYSISFVK